MNFFYELSLFYNEMTKNLGVVKIYEKSMYFRFHRIRSEKRSNILHYTEITRKLGGYLSIFQEMYYHLKSLLKH